MPSRKSPRKKKKLEQLELYKVERPERPGDLSAKGRLEYENFILTEYEFPRNLNALTTAEIGRVLVTQLVRHNDINNQSFKNAAAVEHEAFDMLPDDDEDVTVFDVYQAIQYVFYSQKGCLLF